MIYFVQCGDGPIKIGLVSDAPGRVVVRVSMLQIGCPYPLRLLGTVPGNRWSETDIHDRFDDLRLRGEWFRPEPRLLAFISSCLSRGVVPPDDKPVTPSPITTLWTGSAIKGLRDALGLKMAQFARLVGVSEATVSLWESDRRHPKWAAMVKLNEIEGRASKATA